MQCRENNADTPTRQPSILPPSSKICSSLGACPKARPPLQCMRSPLSSAQRCCFVCPGGPILYIYFLLQNLSLEKLYILLQFFNYQFIYKRKNQLTVLCCAHSLWFLLLLCWKSREVCWPLTESDPASTLKPCAQSLSRSNKAEWQSPSLCVLAGVAARG